MTGAQQVLTIDESLMGEERQSRRVALDDAPAPESPNGDVVASELAVWRLIRAEGKKFMIGDIAHASLRDTISRQDRRFFARVKRAAFRVLPLVEISSLRLGVRRHGGPRVRSEPSRPQTPALARITTETPRAERL